MKQLLVFLFLLCSTSMFAQDVIVKKDGSTIVCRVVELTSSEITYKKWSDLNGSNYVMNRADASAINYESGKKVNLSEATNLYTPNNQNDGTQQYNDRALLGMDYASHDPLKKVKYLRTIGWAGGIGLVVAGAIWAASASGGDGNSASTIGGLAMCGGGVLWTTGFLIAANQAKQIANKRLQSSSIYQQHITFPNGSSLSLGTDLLRDNTLGQNTLGLGLRYNF